MNATKGIIRKYGRLALLIFAQVLAIWLALGWFRQIAGNGLARAANGVTWRFMPGDYVTGLFWDATGRNVKWPAAESRLHNAQLHGAIRGQKVKCWFDVSGRWFALPVVEKPSFKHVYIDEYFKPDALGELSHGRVRYIRDGKTVRYDVPLRPPIAGGKKLSVFGGKKAAALDVFWTVVWGLPDAPGDQLVPPQGKEILTHTFEFPVASGVGEIHFRILGQNSELKPDDLVYMASSDQSVGHGGQNSAGRLISVGWGEQNIAFTPSKWTLGNDSERLARRLLETAGCPAWSSLDIARVNLDRIKRLTAENAMLTAFGIRPGNGIAASDFQPDILQAVAAVYVFNSYLYGPARTLVKSNWPGGSLYLLSNAAIPGRRAGQLETDSRYYEFSRRGGIVATVELINVPDGWRWCRGSALAAMASGLNGPPKSRFQAGPGVAGGSEKENAGVLIKQGVSGVAR